MQRRFGSPTSWVILLALAAAGVVFAFRSRPVQHLLLAANPLNQEINLVYWGDFLPEEVVEQFQSEFGIRVNRTHVSSNEELLQAVTQEGGKPFDLAMPSSHIAQHLHKLGKLRDFTPGRLTNLPAAEDNRHVYQFDKGTRFTVPYLRGATGIAYDRDEIDGLPKTWAHLFESDPNRQRTIVLLDDARYMLGSALLYLKHNPNSEEPAEIVAAGDVLKRFAGREVYFENTKVAAMLADGTADLAITRSAEVTRAMAEAVQRWREDGRRSSKDRTRMLMALPEEGSIVYRICFVLLRSGTNQPAAEQFVNFMLRPKIAGQVTNQTCCASALDFATPFVSRFIVNSASYFFHPAGRDFIIQVVDPKAEETYNRVWRDVKATLGARKYTPPRKK